MNENKFDEWNRIKKDLEKKNIGKVPYFYEREVWWCSLGKNIGWEQDGKKGLFSRPVIIFKIFTRDIFWALPLTTTERKGKYYFQYKYKNQRFTAILSQLKLLSSKRLIRKVGYISEDDYRKMKKKIKHIMS